MDNYFKSIGLTKEYKSHSIPCEVCNGEDFIQVLSKARVGSSGVYGELPVCGCKRCGYIMINPRYEKQFYVDYYRRIYRTLTHGCAKPKDEYIQGQKHRGKKIADYLERFISKPGKMLDLGCAAGATMIPFLEKGWDAVGVEPDEACVETGKKELGLNIHLGDAESINFPEGSFDLILCLGTMEHCYDLNASMTAVKRSLKNNGIFLVRNRSEEIFGSVIEYFSNNHYRYFTKQTFELLMARYGFEIEEFQDEPLEDIPGEFYAVARSKYNVSLDVVQKRVSEGFKDDILKRKRYFKRQQEKFIEKSKYLLGLAQKLDYNYTLLTKEALSGRHDLTIMVEASPIDAVKRAVIEAKGALENPIDIL